MLFIVTVQLTSTSLVVEKSQKLREAMRMMGLREVIWVNSLTRRVRGVITTTRI
jgi:hypothetical protein